MATKLINWADTTNIEGKSLKSVNVTASTKSKSLGTNNNQNGGDKSEPDIASRAEVSILMKFIRTGLTESSNLNLVVQRDNPDSPLHSVKTFEALHLKESILKGVYHMGFNKPSKIQETALPALLADPPQNMIAQSQSGTGKTIAFLIAMLSRVDLSLNYPQVLCLAPTYELAIQIGEQLAKLSRYYTDVKLKYVVRGEETPSNKITEHILVGTPGKMMDWSIKYKCFDLQKINVFVLDEADVMIDIQGHHDYCIRIHKLLSKSCQMMFFSATYDKEVMNFAEFIVPNAITIRLTREQETLNNIKQYVVRCSNHDTKYQAIKNIYGGVSIGQAIIFCHTRKNAAWLAAKMVMDGHAVALLSGDLNVEQRLAVLDRFRDGSEKVLITTNVLSRGIDVEQVTIVVNFDMPLDANGKPDCETYLHRIGRTGRFGKHGIAINLVDSDKSMKICHVIEQHFKKKIHLLNTENPEDIEKMETGKLIY